MKKLFTIIVFAIVLVMCQCNKLVQYSDDAHVYGMANDTKSSTSLISFKIGHSSVGCNGCVPYNGSFIHVNCQGHGNQCSVASSVVIMFTSDGYVAKTTDTFGLTSDDFFNMPARSLSTGESGSIAYLNIPAQLVERDTATLQFTLTGLFFTNKPEYNNF